MSMLLFMLFSAFSFLETDYGMLQQNMFFGYNPGHIRENTAVVMGSLGTLDTKETVFSLSKRHAFFKAMYRSFGIIEVRGDIPDDEHYTNSYPYLFEIETGGNTSLSGKTKLGASISLFEQRIMTDNLRGYAFNIGGVYVIQRFKVGGYIRNVGAKVGYDKIERYSLPKEGAFYGIYYDASNTVSFELSLDDLKLENRVIYLSYIRKLKQYLSLGTEVALEKDFSFGYTVKYPLDLMLRLKMNKYNIGLSVKIPKGAMDIQNSLYLGVDL